MEGRDPVVLLCLHLTIVLFVGRLAGHLANRLRQPAVLGELLAGMVLGALPIALLQQMRTDAGLDLMARLGVLLLLFQVGLESTVRQMLAVGVAAMRVATIGVVVPLVLGWLVARALLPHEPTAVHAFLGATLTATSVGITARVLRDMGTGQTDEARLILGAAVIDDVLGLVLLAVVTGAIASGGSVQPLDVLFISSKAIGFLAVALSLGVWLAPRVMRAASHLHATGALLATGLGLCFALAWLASVAGLAPIVGAFAAGLVLEDVHYRDFTDRGELGLEKLVAPIGELFVPVFFVLMGLRTDLTSFLTPGVPLLALALVVVAIGGKIVAGLGAGRSMDRLAVGLGMIPRGEVGLIFASIGQGLHVDGKPVINAQTYGAVLAMVVATTLITPPLLRWRMARMAQSA